MEEPHTPGIIVRRNYRLDRGDVRWARSATKHRISRERSIHVVENSNLWFEQAPPPGGDPRVVVLGVDTDGIPLEVIAAELRGGGILIIHAMPMRGSYRNLYEGSR